MDHLLETTPTQQQSTATTATNTCTNRFTLFQHTHTHTPIRPLVDMSRDILHRPHPINQNTGQSNSNQMSSLLRARLDEGGMRSSSAPPAQLISNNNNNPLLHHLAQQQQHNEFTNNNQKPVDPNVSFDYHTCFNSYQQDEMDIRADPEYAAYFYSNSRLDPRLPLPVYAPGQSSWQAWQATNPVASSKNSANIQKNPIASGRATLESYQSAWAAQQPQHQQQSSQHEFRVNQQQQQQLSPPQSPGMPSRRKTIVDMIQEDFPRTPSPVFAMQQMQQQRSRSGSVESTYPHGNDGDVPFNSTIFDSFNHQELLMETGNDRIVSMTPPPAAHGLMHDQIRPPRSSSTPPVMPSKLTRFEHQYVASPLQTSSSFEHESLVNAMQNLDTRSPDTANSNQSYDQPQMMQQPSYQQAFDSSPRRQARFSAQQRNTQPNMRFYNEPSSASVQSSYNAQQASSALFGASADVWGRGMADEYYGGVSPVIDDPHRPMSGFGTGAPQSYNNNNSRQYYERSSPQQQSYNQAPYGHTRVQPDMNYGQHPQQHQHMKHRADPYASADPTAHNRSGVLEEFRNNKNRKFELRDILGHVVEFSGDQHGSRFIQQKLETSHGDDKDLVFQELLPSALQLMTDVFGNYVIQKFFEFGSQVQKSILARRMEGHVVELSIQMYGCRVVQKAVEHVLLPEQSALMHELEGNILMCVKDQNGNHVIQKAIERIPADQIQFVLDSFKGQIYSLATHPYGCRVMQRIFEHCATRQTGPLLEELQDHIMNLVQDQYGNYVIQHILEKGRPEDRHTVIIRIKGQLLTLSKHKFASNVIEKCIIAASIADRQALIEEVIGQKQDGTMPLMQMMKDQYANYVIQKMLDVSNDGQRELLISKIRPHFASLRKFTYGKHIIAKIERITGVRVEEF